MENQHRKIAGYCELSQVEIDLMNRIKAKGEEIGALYAEVLAHLDMQLNHAAVLGGQGDNSEAWRLEQATPFRWLALARTDAQTSIMAAVRAVAQPTTF